ncbi:MAG: efflux transporter outer membrane subunit [Pseudomonadota bacterium]
MKKAALLVATASLAACTVGPDYVSPGIDLTTRFFRGGDTELLHAATELWWLKFNDPLLAEYIERGNARSLSLEAALERINAAQAAVEATGLNAQLDGGLTVAPAYGGTFGQANSDQFTTTVRFGAEYVFDIFGGQKRSREQAVARYEAAQFNVGAVRIALISEITDAYIRARFFQTAASITRTTIAARQRLVDTVRQLRAAGAATQLDVDQALSTLASAKAALPAQENGFEANVIRLAALLSLPSAHLIEEMRKGHRQPRPLGFSGAGIPANLLRNRPDVREAERDYAAAVAGIGIAEAALFPSVTLGGTLGLTTGSNQSTVRTWSFGPSINVPVFNRGVLNANRRRAISVARQEEIAWRQSVLDAVEDVETALSNCFHLSRQVSAIEEALVFARRVVELSRAGYQARETSLTDLINAEIALANERLSLASSYRDFSLAFSQLQVAAGKGWAAPGLQTADEVIPANLEADPLALPPLKPPVTINKKK